MPYGVPTVVTVIIGAGLVAGGVIPQDALDKIPSQPLSEWVGPPGMLLLLYEAGRRALNRFRAVEEDYKRLKRRQARIMRELGLEPEQGEEDGD